MIPPCVPILWHIFSPHTKGYEGTDVIISFCCIISIHRFCILALTCYTLFTSYFIP